jgi:hypothetical protein
MKGIAVVCLLALAGVVVALDEQVPTLPGLGSPCLQVRDRADVRWAKRWEKPAPRAYLGQCTRDTTCPVANQVHGYCAGIGVVCCKGGSPVTPQVPNPPQPQTPAPGRPILQATPGAGCTNIRGTCKSRSLCAAPNVVRTGLCPGSADNICCAPGGTPPSTGGGLADLVPIPAGINPGLSFPSASFQTSKLGAPGCPLSSSCFSCGCATSARIRGKLLTDTVTSSGMRITGIRPFVLAVKAAFAAMRASGRADAIAAERDVTSAGGLCCRPIKKNNGQPGSSYSNHSWGMALDVKFQGRLDPRGDRKAQRGLTIMAPFFAAQKLYWAAGYSGSSEDAMHFEASTQVILDWERQGLLR